MKKFILISLLTYLFATGTTYAYTSEMTNGVQPARAAVASPQPVAHKPAAKKKGFNFFGLFDMLGRLESFVKGKTKQNENVIEEASNGNVEVAHKRAIAADPAARKVQEKMDKAQAERLQKLEDVVGK